MRINRELRLYLGFEASETLVLQHGFGHMRLCSQPTWHLLNRTPAKDTYLLPPIMLPPYHLRVTFVVLHKQDSLFILIIWFFHI